MRPTANRVTLTGRERMRALLIGLGAAVAAWLLYIGMDVTTGHTGPFDQLDNAVQELVLPHRAYRWRGSLARVNRWSKQVVVVTIDDETLQDRDHFKKWPIPRQRYAEMIDMLDRAGARAIGLDIMFEQEQDRNPGGDAALAAALARHANVILADRAMVNSHGELGFEDPLPLLTRGWSEAERRARLGATTEDNDQYITHVPLVLHLPDGKDWRYSYDALLAARLADVPLDEIQDAPRRPGDPNFRPGFLRFGNEQVPLDDSQEMLINYFWGGSLYPPTAATDPFLQYLDAKQRLNYFHCSDLWQMDDGQRVDFFKDRVVLVGVTLTGGFDVKSTPMGRMAGIDIHALSILTLVSGDFLRSLPPLTLLALLVPIGLLLGLIVPRVPSYVAAIVGAVMGAGVALGLPYEFIYHNQIFKPALPLLGLLLSFVSVTAYQLVTEQNKKRRLTELLHEVAPMPDNLVEKYLATREGGLTLGGTESVVSILFSDIRGYTDMSETMDSSQVFATINELYTETGHILHRHGGAIFDYQGDAQMVVFGLDPEHPDHADEAVHAGLEMMDRLKELNDAWEKSGRKRLDMGVGVNTGRVTLGVMGSEQRKQFSAIGDVTNVAARLQALSAQLSTPVIISQGTLDMLKGSYATEQVTGVKLKGKANLMTVYKVLGVQSPESRQQTVSR